MGDPKPYTKEESREMVLSNIRGIVSYWDNLEGRSSQTDRLEGVAFSMLTMIDGCSNLPAMDITIRPHEDDKQYSINNGERWFKDGTVINDDCHLHDIFCQEKG